MSAPTNSGSCRCGAIAFEISADVTDVIVCHCSICRRLTGGNGIAVVIVDNDHFRWTQGEDLIENWQKPKGNWQSWFCRKCGSTLPGRNDELRMFVPAVLISGADHALTVTDHIWVDSRAPWDRIADSGRQHPQEYSK